MIRTPTRLLGRGGGLYSAEEDRLRDLHSGEDDAGMFSLSGPAVVLGSSSCSCCRRFGGDDGVSSDGLRERKAVQNATGALKENNRSPVLPA